MLNIDTQFGETDYLEVQVLSECPKSLFEEAASFEGVTLYHTPEWHRLLTRTFGWCVQAITVRNCAGRLVWYLPFVRKRRLWLNRVSVCLPLSNRVGPAVALGFDSSRLQIQDGIWPLEIHERAEIPQHHCTVQHHVTILDLARHRSVDDLRRSFHKTCVQRSLSKAEKAGIKIAKGTERRDFEVFSSLQTQTRQRQGSPTYPPSFFTNMWEELAPLDAVHLHLAYLDERPVCGVLFLRFGDTAIYGYGASLNDRSIWRTGANQLAMWSAIREAFEDGLSRVDFGTSPVSQPDLRIYKERWGAESQDLAYTYVGAGKRGIQVDRTSRSVRVAKVVLRRLPEPIFAWISPFITAVVV